MALLGPYLVAAGKAPFVWGTHDCCTFVADWVRLRGHADPMAFIRGDYHDAVSAVRRILRGGGLVPLWTRGMIDALVPECDEPRLGDVGVVAAATADGPHEACAIYAGDKWFTLAVRGIEAGPATPLRIWRV